MKKIEMQDGVFWLDENNIIRVRAATGSSETMEDARRHLEIMRDLADGRTLPAVVDLRGLRSTTREAREFYGSEEYAEVVSAAALIVGDSISRVIGNFYVGLNKGIYPIKLFTDESEALQWVKKFIQRIPQGV